MKEFNPKITPGNWGLEDLEFYEMGSKLGPISISHNPYLRPMLYFNKKGDRQAICAVPELLEVMKFARKAVGATCTWSDLKDALAGLELALKNLDEMHGSGE